MKYSYRIGPDIVRTLLGCGMLFLAVMLILNNDWSWSTWDTAVNWCLAPLVLGWLVMGPMCLYPFYRFVRAFGWERFAFQETGFIYNKTFYDYERVKHVDFEWKEITYKAWGIVDRGKGERLFVGVVFDDDKKLGFSLDESTGLSGLFFRQPQQVETLRMIGAELMRRTFAIRLRKRTVGGKFQYAASESRSNRDKDLLRACAYNE